MTRPCRVSLGGIVLLAGTGLATGVFLAYQRDIRKIRASASSGSQMIETRYGPIEYAIVGEGEPVLLIHATGGDYRQALLMGRMFVGEGFQLIAPSRPGYLRTPQAADPSAAGQADVLASLLDALNINKAHLVAMSAGGPVGMQFAIRHPERMQSLVLLSTAAYAPPAPESERKLPAPDFVYQTLFSSDFLFWAIVRAAGPLLQASFGATPELQARISPEEKANLKEMIEDMLPIRMHSAGLDNDAVNAVIPEPLPLERIASPTLVVQAADDPAAVPAGGRYTAEHITGAELVWLEDGGHVLLGHHSQVRQSVREFLNRVRSSG